jgi:hypothetical protein
MGIRDNFTPEEWARIVGAPMLAGMAVTAAEPGGLWSAVRESAASAGGLLAGRSADNDLVAAVVSAFETSEGRSAARDELRRTFESKKPPEMVEAALAELGAISAIVSAKAPDDAAGFKAWLNEIAKRVAEAGSEGGFLGFGGEKVSAAETATLERIASALA